MNEDNDLTEDDVEEHGGLKEHISGLGQKIIGEVQRIGGVLTADPLTEAEGEFNVEVGELREETEEDLEASEPPNRRDDE